MALKIHNWNAFVLTILAVLCSEKVLASECSENDTVRRCSEPIVVSIVWNNATAQYEVINGTVDNRVAWANFTDQIDATGWSFLKVVTNESWPDQAQAYAAGMAEGYATTELLYLHWMNTVEGYCEEVNDVQDGYCDRLNDFLVANQRWIQTQVNLYGDTDSYWHQVALIQTQLQGLKDGFQDTFPKKRDSQRNILTDFGFLFMNIGGDLEDLESALNKTSVGRILGSGSCSAMVKLLPDNADLMVAHTTWVTYQSMLRVLKKYEFFYHETSAPDSPLIAGFNMTFSSYPGALYSMDDFYTISSGLVTLETTIGNNNAALWQFVSPKSVLEYARTMVANRLASTGQLWTTYFLKYNSGTYNNEWMVVDYKKFVPGLKKLKNGLLWVAEQLPGTTMAEDRTDTLRNQSYWASYNAPYFPTIFNLSGCPALVDQYGDWFSYDRAPRALIFQRDHSKVTDLESMRKLMRYNDYQNDPLSRCNCTPPYSAENAIAARSDLNPANGTYEFSALGHRSHGAIDLKITNNDLFQSLQFQASAGPTFDDQPPFRWSTFDEAETTPHLGHPDLWNFEPIIAEWQ